MRHLSPPPLSKFFVVVTVAKVVSDLDDPTDCESAEQCAVSRTPLKVLSMQMECPTILITSGHANGGTPQSTRPRALYAQADSHPHHLTRAALQALPRPEQSDGALITGADAFRRVSTAFEPVGETDRL